MKTKLRNHNTGFATPFLLAQIINSGNLNTNCNKFVTQSAHTRQKRKKRKPVSPHYIITQRKRINPRSVQCKQKTCGSHLQVHSHACFTKWWEDSRQGCRDTHTHAHHTALINKYNHVSHSVFGRLETTHSPSGPHTALR